MLSSEKIVRNEDKVVGDVQKILQETGLNGIRPSAPHT